MPHIANTPESIVSRADSLNPATTCRGITANGRPCRRAIASPASSSPSRYPAKHNGTSPVAPSSLYCWQHKDQAVTGPAPNDPRTSIDSLMGRLGVLDINDAKTDPKKRREARKIPNKNPRKQTKRTVCCCFQIIEDEVPIAPRPRPSGNQPASKPPQRPHQMQQVPSGLAAKPQRPSSKTSSQAGLLSPSQTPSRPSLHSPQSSSSSQTKSLLAWIPQTLTPQTTSVLLTELAKPISNADEPGYIYIFWVTPATSSRSGPPSFEVASSLLPDSSPGRNRRTSDALQTARDINALTPQPTCHSPGAIRLKIGRTSNVQRRMNEWTRQCSHDLTLIRYYPYTPSASDSMPGRKVPHVHRVERLIHLELGDIRIRDLGRCDECGKEHREWFEVAAERSALKRVDDCIRRWVQWAERQ
ncbi:DUF1766-domain-containing protein [Aspergillus ambiguus]|uniref:uncharacterized protein n=1 Tax=Aspergillus ambiguus TaxID=176160 RepID=UPI003CCE26CB